MWPEVAVDHGVRRCEILGAIVQVLKLLKVGALVRISVRSIKLAIASACPGQDEFALAHIRLRNAAA